MVGLVSRNMRKTGEISLEDAFSTECKGMETFLEGLPVERCSNWYESRYGNKH